MHPDNLVLGWTGTCCASELACRKRLSRSLAILEPSRGGVLRPEPFTIGVHLTASPGLAMQQSRTECCGSELACRKRLSRSLAILEPSRGGSEASWEACRAWGRTGWKARGTRKEGSGGVGWGAACRLLACTWWSCLRSG